MTISEDANAAADYIEEHGWCRNELRDLDGRVCMRGAIYGGLGLYKLEDNWTHDLENRAYQTEMAVRESIQNYVPDWNDCKASGQEEVIQVLRNVAIKHQPDAMNSEGGNNAA